jgi:hypothetical protein
VRQTCLLGLARHELVAAVLVEARLGCGYEGCHPEAVICVGGEAFEQGGGGTRWDVAVRGRAAGADACDAEPIDAATRVLGQLEFDLLALHFQAPGTRGLGTCKGGIETSAIWILQQSVNFRRNNSRDEGIFRI